MFNRNSEKIKERTEMANGRKTEREGEGEIERIEQNG